MTQPRRTAPDPDVVVVPAVTGPTAPIPYEKQDRTPAGPLQHLEIFLAAWLGIDRQLLVSLAGTIAEYGSAALFAQQPDTSGADEPTGYFVASYDARTARFAVAPHGQVDRASDAFFKRVEQLS